MERAWNLLRSSSMKLAASLLACAILLAGAADASAAKKDKDKAKDAPSSTKPALVGSYGDWKVYHSAAGKTKICYLLSQPKKRDPDDANREQAYAFISERPSEHVRNEISFVMGTDLIAAGEEKKKPKKPKKGDAEAASPTVAVGDAEFDLAPKGSDLWIKNPAEEGKVIEEMRKGANLVIKAAARKGGHVIDTYSLSGFSQAVDKALKDCPES
jgi:invasion protein IalB